MAFRQNTINSKNKVKAKGAVRTTGGKVGIMMMGKIRTDRQKERWREKLCEMTQYSPFVWYARGIIRRNGTNDAQSNEQKQSATSRRGERVYTKTTKDPREI
jgi:hypothetical protein